MKVRPLQECALSGSSSSASVAAVATVSKQSVQIESKVPSGLRLCGKSVLILWDNLGLLSRGPRCGCERIVAGIAVPKMVKVGRYLNYY
jgi:hypothetical protein